MRILISDTSVLIDLRKASLLEAFIQLPYDLQDLRKHLLSS
jgi:hypothetical protein